MVIALIAIVIVLLLPAIHSAREMARKLNCQSNLRQIGIALQARHDAHRTLPPGWVAKDEVGRPGWAWGSYLLPHLEETAVDKRVRRNQAIDDPGMQDVRETVIPVFLCPSEMLPELFVISEREDDHEDSPDASDEDIGDEVDEEDEKEGVHRPSLSLARASYVGVFGSNRIEDGVGNGVFYKNSRIRFRDLVRGQSKTLFVGERSARLGPATWVGAVPNTEKGAKRVVGSARQVPNDVFGHFDSFSSPHNEGVHFLMGDGSIQVISYDIEKSVFRALASRDMVLPDDDGYGDGHEDEHEEPEDGHEDDRDHY